VTTICSWLINWRWRFGLVGNVVGRINEVNQRRARLVLGWVTVFKTGKPSWYVTSHQGQLSLAIPPRVGKRSTGDDYTQTHIACCWTPSSVTNTNTSQRSVILVSLGPRCPLVSYLLIYLSLKNTCAFSCSLAKCRHGQNTNYLLHYVYFYFMTFHCMRPHKTNWYTE